MTTDLMTAAVPAVIAPIIGYGLAIILFKKTIALKYSVTRKLSTGANIYYWCGAVAFLGVAQGFAVILNELLYVLLNDSQIKVDNIYKGIVLFLVFPFIIFLFTLLLRTLFKDKNHKIKPSPENETYYSIAMKEVTENKQRDGLWAMAIARNSGDANKATADYINTRVAELAGKLEVNQSNVAPINNKLYYIMLFIIIIGVGFYFNFNDRKESALKVSNCQVCGKNGCNPIELFSDIKVEPPNVYLTGNGIAKKLSNIENMKCVFFRENNFSFQCEEYNDFGGGLFKSDKYSFNGKDKFTIESSVNAGSLGRSNSISTCRIE